MSTFQASNPDETRSKDNAMSQDGNPQRLSHYYRPRASWPAAGISSALQDLQQHPLTFSQAGGHLASRPASSESWSASAESTDQSSDNESVAHSQFGADGEDGGSHTLSADGDAPESPPLSRRHGGGRRTPPELTLPDSSDSPLRSFRARPPGHRKRPSHVHVLTRMMPTKDGRAATPASPAALRLQADEASSPVSPGTDWKNFVQQFRSARTSLGPTDAIFAALSSPPKRPARTAHSRTSSDTTTYDDQEDSDSSVDEDREREETLRKAEEYFFAGRLSHEGHQSDIM